MHKYLKIDNCWAILWAYLTLPFSTTYFQWLQAMKWNLPSQVNTFEKRNWWHWTFSMCVNLSKIWFFFFFWNEGLWLQWTSKFLKKCISKDFKKPVCQCFDVSSSFSLEEKVSLYSCFFSFRKKNRASSVENADSELITSFCICN